MIYRKISETIKKSALQVPVITVIGPRQSGKTTLVKELFPNYTYVNLEDKATRELAINDYIGFFKKFPEPMIIDEVQRVPEIISAIQVKVDEDRRKNGRFIITGSHQPRFRETVAQSLAGRTTIHTLLPLSLEEIKQSGMIEDLDENIIRGFMPELYLENSRNPNVYYRDYLNTYIEKDLRQMIAVKNLDSFLRFITLLSGRIGQVVNLSTLSGEVGVSSTTLGEWLSVLEDSFIVFKLQPYFTNISKRIVKSPKVYFVEPGLATYLLGIENPSQASRDPLRGNIFENIVVLEAMKSRLNDNKEPNLYYVRTEKGLEVDLILKKEGFLIPYEIKSSMTPNTDFSKSMRRFCSCEPASKGINVIYCGESYDTYQECKYIHYQEVASSIRN
ncbi:MAG: ATP-binding protein [Sphaerochaetaceae bacterium]|nr:ATP-binding protein [Sphaerochaetaceae bacterium]